MIYFCTYFDKNYLSKFLNLKSSLESFNFKFTFYALCLDDYSFDFFKKHSFANVEAISLDEIENEYDNLIKVKNDRELIEKKIGLLEELGRHAQAISYIKEKVDKNTFKDIHSRTLPYLLQQSAGFNEYNDAYEVNKKLVELNGNSESQDYVIKNSLGKGYNIDAEYFIKKAIKKNPNNKKLLIQEMELYKPIKDKERFEKKVLENHEKFPNDTDITYNYNLIMYNRAKTYVENRQFDLALKIYEDLVSSPDFTKESEQQIFGIYLELGQFDEATEQVDKLIG